MAEALKASSTLEVPEEVKKGKAINSAWQDDIAPESDFEVYKNETMYDYNDIKDAELINKDKVKNATTNYKNRKVGHISLFSVNDKLAA